LIPLKKEKRKRRNKNDKWRVIWNVYERKSERERRSEKRKILIAFVCDLAWSERKKEEGEGEEVSVNLALELTTPTKE
jgi:hypothetical protein